ncbi:hypothetical protein JCM11251_004712 [Rhodosporidiobolus azoricus]
MSRPSALAPEPPHFSHLTSKFYNPWPSAAFPSFSRLLSSGGWVGLPDYKLREQRGVKDVQVVKPDWGRKRIKTLLREADERGEEVDLIAATWLGHAGAFVEIPLLAAPFSVSSPRGGQGSSPPTLKCLFDPIFSQRAGPGIGPKRLKVSPCTVEDLPGVHIVFISHNHYDHLDLATIQDVVRLYPQALYFVPLGNKSWFLSLSIPPTQVFELDWWNEVDLPSSHFRSSLGPSRYDNPASGPAEDSHRTARSEERIRITCIPAQHTSGRGICDQRSTLWCGWLVERLVPAEGVTPASPSTYSSRSIPPTGHTPRSSVPRPTLSKSYLSWARRPADAPPSRPQSPVALDGSASSRAADEKREKNRGWIRRGAIFHAGDTGYRPFADSPDVCPAFASLGEHFGPLDLAFVPIWRGGTLGFVSAMSLRLRHENLPCATHGSPGDAVAIHLVIRSRNTIGMSLLLLPVSPRLLTPGVNPFEQAFTSAPSKART